MAAFQAIVCHGECLSGLGFAQTGLLFCGEVDGFLDLGSGPDNLHNIISIRSGVGTPTPTDLAYAWLRGDLGLRLIRPWCHSLLGF